MARATADRLKQLKEDIAAGLYLPDSRAVAEKMLKRWCSLHGRGARRDTVEDGSTGEADAPKPDVEGVG